MVGPGPHAKKGLLCLHDAVAHHRQFRPVMIWAPPDQILDLPLPYDIKHVTGKDLRSEK